VAWSKQATILGPPGPAPSGTGLVKTAAGILVNPAALLVNADVDNAAAIAESKLTLASDAAAGTASRRTLGTAATAACAGNDARLTNARTPLVNDAEGDPAAIGTAADGTSVYAARRDHVHAGDHVNLASKGTNTHAQIDTHLSTGAKHLYSIPVGAAMYSPLDNSYVYFGGMLALVPGARANSAIYLSSAGVIKEACIKWVSTGVAGSGESISVVLGRNGGGVGDVWSWSVANTDAVKYFRSAVLNVALTTSDYFDFTIWCSWATNPTNVYLSGYVLVQA